LLLNESTIKVSAMISLPARMLCLLAILAGCAASGGSGYSAGNLSVSDPFGGRYPMIGWQSWTFDVPVGMEVALDCGVRRAVGRANGFTMIEAEAIPGVLAVMRGNPEVRMLAEAVGFSKPGDFVFLGADAVGGQPGARVLILQGHLTAAGLVCELDLYDVRESNGVGGGSGQQLVPEGHAQIWLWHGADPAQPATWCLVLPNIWRRMEDVRFPVQSGPAGNAEER